MEWCEHHKNDPVSSTDDDSDSRKKSTDIEEWDQKYMQVDQEMLFEIILVSHTAPQSLKTPHTNHNYRPPTTSISRPFSMSAARPSPT
jgi:hypothetical protein